MVLAYVEGETMSGESLRSAAMARRMAESIRQLHEARARLDFDMSGSPTVTCGSARSGRSASRTDFASG